MADVPAGTPAPAVSATAATQQAASAQAQSVTVEPMVALSKADYESLKGAVHRANRVADELNGKIEALQRQPASAATETQKPPAGVEERLNQLANELESERKARAEEKLQMRIMESASKHGVAPDRIDYLNYKLRMANPGLSSDGVRDASNPSASISVDTLVTSLLSTPEGSVFKPAPAAASLPSAGNTSAASVAGKTMKLSEWNGLAKRCDDAYRQAHAAVKAGELRLVDD